MKLFGLYHLTGPHPAGQQNEVSMSPAWEAILIDITGGKGARSLLEKLNH